MIGTAIRKYAEAHGMTCDGGCAYGKVNGRHIALMDGYGVKELQIYLYPPACIVEHALLAQIMQTLTDCDEREYRLVRGRGVSMEKGRAVVAFHDSPGVIKRVERYIDEIMPRLDQLELNADECACCAERLDGDPRYLRIDDCVLPLHSGCVNRMAERTEVIRAAEKDGSVLRGALGAFLGALLGAIPWVIIHVLGVVAGFAGLVIGGLANSFYGRFGGRNSRARMAVVIAALFFGVLLGQTVGTSAIFAHDYSENGGMNALGMTRAQYIATCWDQYIIADQAKMLSNAYDRRFANLPENQREQYMSRDEFITLEWNEGYASYRAEAIRESLCDMGVGLLFGCIGCISLFTRFNHGSEPKNVRRLK